MNHVGFTGTRKGMTDIQRVLVRRALADSLPAVLHHGDCVGADEQAHEIAVALGLDIIIHPPEDEKFRAFCMRNVVEIRPQLPYMPRNRNMVSLVGKLIATPRTPYEIVRSGTWATVRYARKVHTPIILCKPSLWD